MHDDVIVVTASAESFPGLVARLREFPVTVREQPLMRFAPPEDWTSLDTAMDAVLGGAYTTIVFTSPRAARTVVDRARQRGLAWPAAGQGWPRTWVAGPGTARALAGTIDTVCFPDHEDLREHGAANAVARAMLAAKVHGPVLFPCGDRRRDVLPAQLRAAGIEVDEVVCYRSVLASEREAREALSGAAILVVTSPSVASLLAAVAAPEARPKLLAVGPTTAAAAEAAGWHASAVAAQPTPDAVYAAAQPLLE